MDSDLEDAMSAHTPDHDQIVRFRRSGNGLHCHDTHNRDVVMMNGQCENGLLFIPTHEAAISFNIGT